MRSLVALVLLNACSGSSATFVSQPDADTSGSEAALPRTLERTCNDVAAVACTELETCPALWPQFATSQACFSRMRARCLRDASAPGVIDIAPHLDRCVNLAINLPCEERYRTLSSCIAAPGAHLGQLPIGAACWTHAQCASGSCGGNDLPLEAKCGTCRPTPRAGEACINGGDCSVLTFRERDTDMLCDDRTLSCIVGDREGTQCSIDTPRCAPPMACVEGRCRYAAPVTKLAAIGEACRRRNGSDASDPRPFCRGGSWCDLSNVCVPTLQIGAACGGEAYACGWDAACAWRDGGERCVLIEELCR